MLKLINKTPAVLFQAVLSFIVFTPIAVFGLQPFLTDSDW
jgi:hypothetical protein